MAFINKMDREGADFFGTFDEIRKRLEGNPLAIQIPVGIGPPHMPDAFRGVIDLVRMKLVTFSKDSQGSEVIEADIPAEQLAEAELWRGQMLDQLFDYSNELGELLLAEEDVPEDLIRQVIRSATIHSLVVRCCVDRRSIMPACSRSWMRSPTTCRARPTSPPSKAQIPKSLT